MNVTAGLRDIKGPIELPSYIMFVLLAAALVLAIVGLCFWLFRLRKEKVKDALLPMSAYQTACQQLEALSSRGLPGLGRIKEYYIEVSGIVRRYLENRFGLNAPEMTTEEFLAGLRDSARLKGEHKLLLKEFLVACDMVKFAKYAPSGEEIASVYSSARNFVEQTRDDLP